MFKWEVTSTERAASDPAPRSERNPSSGSDAPASPRAARSVGVVAQSADQRVGFVFPLVCAAVLLELAYRIVW